jgi:hypothetical protein
MDLDSIRSCYNIEDLVSGLKGSSSSRWGICPLPQHKHSSRPTPSFSVFWKYYKGQKVQYFKCHGNCGLTGTVIDLAGYMWVAGYHKYDINMYQKAAEALSGGKCQINPPNAPPPVPELPDWLAQDMLPPSKAVVDYALSRGIDINQLEKFSVGTPKEWMKGEPYDIRNPQDWMAIPTFHHDRLFGIKLRNITNKGLRYMSIKGSKKGLWNHNAVWMRGGPTIVTKGEIAGMVLASHGFNQVCAPTAGEGGRITEITQAVSLSKNIVIGDNDDKGREAGIQRAALLSGCLHFPPQEFKDVDQWINKRPQEAMNTMKRWLEEL